MTIATSTSTRDPDRPEAASSGSEWARDSAGILRLETASTWRDRLVDLVVLAEHGDEGAARVLRSWLRDDVTVQAAYQTIADDVEAVRMG
jgi:hypothetical protein